ERHLLALAERKLLALNRDDTAATSGDVTLRCLGRGTPLVPSWQATASYAALPPLVEQGVEPVSGERDWIDQSEQRIHDALNGARLRRRRVRRSRRTGSTSVHDRLRRSHRTETTSVHHERELTHAA